MSGKLSKIYICSEKNADRELVSEAILDKKHGLIGDYKSEFGDENRQLLILLDNDRQNIDKNYKDKGLCTKRFKENLLIEGFNLSELSEFTRFKIGESTIEITAIGKKCFDQCELVKKNELCPLKEGVIFARVIESGIVKIADTIRIV